VHVQTQKASDGGIVAYVALDSWNLPLPRGKSSLEAQLIHEPAEFQHRGVIHQQIHVGVSHGPPVRAPVALPLTVCHSMGFQRLRDLTE
jgi:hypothetical protein